MSNRLMDRIRAVLGMRPATPPPMTDEQERVNEQLNRIAARQKAVDIQVDVIRADSRDVRRP